MRAPFRTRCANQCVSDVASVQIREVPLLDRSLGWCIDLSIDYGSHA
jgi:hypothetical protein